MKGEVHILVNFPIDTSPKKKTHSGLCRYHLHQSSDNPTKIHPPRRSLSRSKLTQGRLPKVKIPLSFHEIINTRRQQTRERTKAFSSSEWMLPMWLRLFSHSSRQLENIDSEWKKNLRWSLVLTTVSPIYSIVMLLCVVENEITRVFKSVRAIN